MTMAEMEFMRSAIPPIFTELLDYVRERLVKDPSAREDAFKFLVHFVGVHNIRYNGLVKPILSPTLDILEELSSHRAYDIEFRRNAIRAAHEINGAEYLQLD